MQRTGAAPDNGLYSHRMQIEQNFRDDKSPRFGVRSEAEPESGKRATGSAEYGRGWQARDVAGRLQGRKAVFTLALSGKQHQAQTGSVST